MFTCKECNKTYTYKANYIRHLDIKHKQNKTITNPNLNIDINTDTDMDFIIINNSYFDKNDDKNTSIFDLKKQLEEYIIKCEKLELELKNIKEMKDEQIINYFMKYKVYTYCGTFFPLKYNQLFLKK